MAFFVWTALVFGPRESRDARMFGSALCHPEGSRSGCGGPELTTSVSRNRTRLVSRTYALAVGKVHRSLNTCTNGSGVVVHRVPWAPENACWWACAEQEGTHSERLPGDSCCPFPIDMTAFVEGRATREAFLNLRL